MWVWSVLGQTQTLSGPCCSLDKYTLHKWRSFCCERRWRWQKVWLNSTTVFISRMTWQTNMNAFFHFMFCLASLYGGASIPLTEDQTLTIPLRKVWTSPGVALQRKDSAKKCIYRKRRRTGLAACKWVLMVIWLTASKLGACICERLIFIKPWVLVVNTGQGHTDLPSQHHIMLRNEKTHLSNTVCI